MAPPTVCRRGGGAARSAAGRAVACMTQLTKTGGGGTNIDGNEGTRLGMGGMTNDTFLGIQLEANDHAVFSTQKGIRCRWEGGGGRAVPRHR